MPCSHRQSHNNYKVGYETPIHNLIIFMEIVMIIDSIMPVYACVHLYKLAVVHCTISIKIQFYVN